MMLGILAIALSMAVLTIAAAEVKTQEAAKMQGTGNSSSCPSYKMIQLLYPDCDTSYYTKYDAVIKFRLSIVSTLWDRLVNMNATKYGNEVAKTLVEIYGKVDKKLITLSPKFQLRAEWDVNENTTANGYVVPWGPTWFKKLNVESTPITDLLQDGKFINILLIDGFKGTGCKYADLGENTVVQAVGPLFSLDEFDWWSSNFTELTKISSALTIKVAETVGIKKWESTEGSGSCKGIMEGFEDDDFSECSSKEFQSHLESDGGQSLVKWVETYVYKPEIVLHFRVFVNEELANQVKPSMLRSTTTTVKDSFYSTLFSGPLRPRPLLKTCEAEGITVLPWPDAVEGSGMNKLEFEGSGETTLEEAIKNTIGPKNIQTHLNLVMLDKSTFHSISDNLPGHREPITCSNADAILARTLIMWTETNDTDTMIKAKTKAMAITLAKKLGMKDNRQSNKVLKDKLWGNVCKGMMEQHDTSKLSWCSKDDFDEYLDTEKGSCLRTLPRLYTACEKKPTLCKECSNILGDE